MVSKTILFADMKLDDLLTSKYVFVHYQKKSFLLLVSALVSVAPKCKQPHLPQMTMDKVNRKFTQ